MSGYYFHCAHHNCTCPETTCILRQKYIDPSTWHLQNRPYDEYCQSGKCDQGQEILARHRENGRRVPPRTPTTGKHSNKKKEPQPFEEYRKCRLCGLIRHYTEMEKHGQFKDGIGTRCKPCMNVKQREYARLRKARAMKRKETA